MTTQKLTPTGKSYWNGNGIYQKEHDKLFKELVPTSGAAETVHGELIRAASRLFYDYCNNGNINACEVQYREYDCTCDTCGGEGEDYDGNECEDCYGSGIWSEEEVDGSMVSKYYLDMLIFIRKTLEKSGDKEINGIIDEVADVILLSAGLEIDQEYFSDKNMDAYNKMVDHVMWYVLNSENSPL